MGYVSGNGDCFTARLGREVLAYRKVNDMDRTKKAGAGLVGAVFAGKGAYHVKYPDAGEHVEAPLEKQVLVLVGKNGKPFAIYPISSGKPSTPTITGHFEFLPPGTGRQLGGDGRLLLLAQRLRGPRVPRSAELRRQPRLPADLHRRPAADLRIVPLRRVDLRLWYTASAAAG